MTTDGGSISGIIRAHSCPFVAKRSALQTLNCLLRALCVSAVNHLPMRCTDVIGRKASQLACDGPSIAVVTQESACQTPPLTGLLCHCAASETTRPSGLGLDITPGAHHASHSF